MKFRKKPANNRIEFTRQNFILKSNPRRPTLPVFVPLPSVHQLSHDVITNAWVNQSDLGLFVLCYTCSRMRGDVIPNESDRFFRHPPIIA
ncbi:hypothetical protein GGC63_002409 [Paenibacillus sp. OAS669]|nr:hypothetical protein [Paenibacillus sp. OAS669]